MADTGQIQKAALGDLIFKTNPYTKGKHMRLTASTVTGQGAEEREVNITGIKIEEDEKYAADWMFKGQPHKISKSIRIEYQYEKLDKDGNSLGYMVTDYLLVGFEGSGGSG